jgi:hypothetical protein
MFYERFIRYANTKRQTMAIKLEPWIPNHDRGVGSRISIN